jgi:hypothetical protein
MQDPGGSTGNFLDKPWMVVDVLAQHALHDRPTARRSQHQTFPRSVYAPLRSTDSKGFR